MFRKFFKAIFFTLLAIFLFVFIYLLSETTLSKITTNYSKNENLEYEIFIKSNGVHTDVVLHITYYDEIAEDDLTYKIKISKKQYSLIIDTIKNSLQYKDEKPINIKTTSQYGENDAFYEAIGSYSIFHTCNTWTNNLLKKASLPASFWLAFDDGILYQYNKKSNP